MPYRRLPNTDQARIRALRTALEQGEFVSFLDLPYSYKTKNEAGYLLTQMEQAVHEYKIMLSRQIAAGKEYIIHLKTARLYISHFIQVLNLCVIRNEISSDKKALYQLDLNDQSVPDLSTESALLKWGENIIAGERNRIKNGGVPIYNPSIAKVSAYFENFTDARIAQKAHQNNTGRALEKLNKLHEKVDAVILDLWNQLEEHFNDLPPAEKREQCKLYGICYYYRTGEKQQDEAQKDTQADD